MTMLAAPQVASAGTLDQSQTLHNTQSYIGGDGASSSQTFIAGRTGQLDQVDVELSKCLAGPGMTVTISSVAADGSPYAPFLGSAPVPDASVQMSPGFQFVSVPFASPVPVTAGVQYSIVLTANRYSSFCPPQGVPPYQWGGATGDPYPNGQAWFNGGEGTGLGSSKFGDADLAFRAYVEESPPGPPACSDDADNDADGLIDLADPGCESATDADEADPPPPQRPVASCAGRTATLTGTEEGESLQGTNAGEVIAGLSGPDNLFGGLGDDRLCGDEGRDNLKGLSGDDRLFGGPGPDVLRGNRGTDLIVGGPGNDRCLGGPGDDRERSC
jgi:hypothetical protein